MINPQYRNLFLLIASLVFYGWNEPNALWILIGVITVGYIGTLIARALPKYGLVSGLTILLVLGVLGYYKYTDFIISIYNQLCHKNTPLLNIALPIGISFYVFQMISYIADARKKETKIQKNPLDLALYISLFPQLVAGPIVRYHQIEHQLITRRHSVLKVYQGIRRFIIGFGKKVIIADTLGLTVDKIFSINPIELTPAVAWVGIFLYTLQIYFDFSGYSDMAIGLGRMFGFKFAENFNYPYISRSMTEFWRRWHISLSSWFKEYVYIPLGGNRKGFIRTCLNLALVFLLTGLWHGASLMFVIWGAWNGFFIVLEKIRRKFIAVPLRFNTLLLSHLYTILVILVGFVFFRSDTISYAIKYIKLMFFALPNYPIMTFSYYIKTNTLIIAFIGYLAALGIGKNLLKHRSVFYSVLTDIYLLFVFGISFMLLTAAGYNPFIYFRF